MSRRFLPLLILLVPSLAQADEGMWTFNGFPSERVEKAYGFAPDAAWLEKVRLGSVRLAGGCSASFVSGSGLVMTNHHCAHSCIEQLSTKKKNYVEAGFYAKTLRDEKKCPAMEVNQLVEIEDVTDPVLKALEGKTGEAFTSARKAELAKIEKACATGDDVRCDVVTLYNGGQYHLYKYRRFQDVRLAFAPEIEIAYFGGDPDNFNFPRYVLDVAFVRVYEDGKPHQSKNHFSWSKNGAADQELVFVSGHPGSTRRLKTAAELEYLRDVYLPHRLFDLAEMRGMLTEFRRRGKEQDRIGKTPLFYVENAYKALKGRHAALLDQTFFFSKVKAEQDLKRALRKKPELQKAYGDAWRKIELAMIAKRKMRLDVGWKERHGGFGSRLMRIAQALVRNADEAGKPNEERLREYTDAKRPQLQAKLLSKAPIYPELEIAMMTYEFTKLREQLGPDDPFVKKVLGKDSPEALAKKLIGRTKLKNVALRKKLFEGGKKAVDNSKDPLILFAKKIDADGRTARKTYEDEIESVVVKNSERIAKARFTILGTNTYPDATFSLRLSYGKVDGFEHRGRRVEPFTRIQGLFERATGQKPFQVPRSFVRAKKKIDLQTPMNFVTTNDVIGGNSGSPIFNQQAEIVGIVFDGNIYSLGGDYGFDARVNRTVSVHSSFIREALQKVYGATRILEEIGGSRR